MWLLENDGDVFHGKRLWLRPGKKFIFGRTSAEVGGFVVENKTISRKHLIVEVDPLKPGDCTKPNLRSQITLEDLNTKIGTLVNGIQIRGTRYILDSESNEIKLGQYDRLFRITWKPIVLSFSFTAKELKANPIPALREKLEPLDIKVLVDYIRNSTTHVVAKKRNISKGLQALINGKYIVDHTFIDAVINVTGSTNDEISPLESDFEFYWPNELDYLPPRGSEPTQRTADAYAPVPMRQEIFDGYTFIFCDQSQFENLLGPITNGRGKALLHQVDPSTTKLEDFIRYVKNVAGEKGLGKFEDGSEGKGVVVVRYQPLKGPASDWYADFATRVALSLDHRLIEQNEFLDAILNNDASVLRKPLEVEQSSIVAPPPSASMTTITEPPFQRVTLETTVSKDVDNVSTSSIVAPAQPARRIGRSRRIITSRFKGFDDDIDILSQPESKQADHDQTSTPQMHNLFVSQSQHSEPVQMTSEVVANRTRSNTKRPSSPPMHDEEEGEEEDVLDQLAPAATKLKRSRLAVELSRKRKGEPSAPQIAVTAPVIEMPPKSKKIKPEIDVLEVVRLQREKEEERARAEREALQAAMDGMNIDQIRNLAMIEEMDVKRPAPRSRASTNKDECEGWDDRWNGRKNFKKFRRQGEGTPKLLNKVIVPLTEVKKKDFGIGDEYWLEGSKDIVKNKKGRGNAKEILSQSIGISQSQNKFAKEAPEKEVAEEGGNTDAPTSSQRTTRSQRSSDKTNTSSGYHSQKKRIAEPIIRPDPAKKARQAPRRHDSDDSEDELGFRFRKK